jgi:hypothetical protein
MHNYLIPFSIVSWFIIKLLGQETHMPLVLALAIDVATIIICAAAIVGMIVGGFEVWNILRKARMEKHQQQSLQPPQYAEEDFMRPAKRLADFFKSHDIEGARERKH